MIASIIEHGVEIGDLAMCFEKSLERGVAGLDFFWVCTDTVVDTASVPRLSRVPVAEVFCAPIAGVKLLDFFGCEAGIEEAERANAALGQVAASGWRV